MLSNYCLEFYFEPDYAQSFDATDSYYEYDYALTGYVLDYFAIDVSLNTVIYNMVVNDANVEVQLSIWQPVLPTPSNIWIDA